MQKLFLLLLVLITAAGCKNYSKYPIDSTASVKPDSRLLGIWKAVEDTNSYDFFVVQKAEDIFDDFKKKWAQYKLGSSQDKKIYDNAYNEYIVHKDHYLYLTRMVDSGRGDRYRQWGSFISVVGNQQFLNIEYQYSPGFASKQSLPDERGYLLLRIIAANKAFDTVSVAMVNDPALKHLTSAEKVRRYVAANQHAHAFYTDTLHLYKVSSYHSSLSQTIFEANPKQKR